MTAIHQVMLQGSFFVKNSFEEAFSAWEDSKLAHLGGEIEKGARRFTLAELTKLSEVGDSNESQPPGPPEKVALDLDFEGCSFIIFNISDQKPG